jgi:DNA-binding MarR family transcriptional regulator
MHAKPRRVIDVTRRERLEDDVHWLMARLARSLGVVEQDAVAPFDITLREYVVLLEVESEPGRSQLAVARSAAVDKSMMVSAVDRLEKRGLLLREPHPTDRRVRTLSLTAQGRELLDEASRAVAAAESQLMSLLPGPQRNAFVSTLRHLAAHATDVGFDVTPCV